MMKSIRYLLNILIVLLIIAGIGTVVADSQDTSLMGASDGGSGSFSSEDSFSDGGGSFTSDDSPEEPIEDDGSDDEDNEMSKDTIRLEKHATSNPIILLLISLMSSILLVKSM